MAACLLLWSALAALNLAGALLAALDKHRAAKRRKHRISHLTFRVLSLLGAAPAILVTLRAVRHKTRRHSFLAVLAALGLVGLGAWALLLWHQGCLM